MGPLTNSRADFIPTDHKSGGADTKSGQRLEFSNPASLKPNQPTQRKSPETTA
jgi:hypothetical protein